MTADSLCRPLVGLLDEMGDLIAHLDDDSYAAPAPGRSSGGVGGHVRHCLDHVSALLTAVDTGVCAYDRRVRGTDVELDRRAALRRIVDLQDGLRHCGTSAVEQPVSVETQIDRDGATLVTTSTVGRELVFVANHTVHHNAIVAQLLRGRGVPTGRRFGVAPSTPDPEAQLACAR